MTTKKTKYILDEPFLNIMPKTKIRVTNPKTGKFAIYKINLKNDWKELYEDLGAEITEEIENRVVNSKWVEIGDDTKSVDAMMISPTELHTFSKNDREAMEKYAFLKSCGVKIKDWDCETIPDTIPCTDKDKKSLAGMSLKQYTR